MEETEYKDNEKVLYKTKGKLQLPDNKSEDVDCFVTEGHVVIDAEEPIKIPITHVKVLYYPNFLFNSTSGAKVS